MIFSNEIRNVFQAAKLVCWLLCITCGSSNTTRAEVVFFLDLDINQSGSQTDRRTETGEIFDAYVNLSLTGDTKVSGYTFSIDFRFDEVNILSVDDSLRPAGWFALSSPVRNEQDSRFELISAGSLTDFIDSSFSGPIARLTLEARNPILNPLSDNLMPGFFTAFDGILDENGDAITSGVEFRGGTVTAVPEPSGIGLVGLTGGLVFLRRLRGPNLFAS